MNGGGGGKFSLAAARRGCMGDREARQDAH
jgi:hypothetical protein